MEKKNYYVAVASGDIMTDKTADEFEFEIEATEAEVDELYKLFSRVWKKDLETYVDTHYDIYNNDETEQDISVYDNALTEVYGLIHKLGKPRTKEHIEKLGILH